MKTLVAVALLLNAALAAYSASDVRFAGAVLDASGKPVPGAVVELYRDVAGPRGYPDPGALQRVTTGADGRFEFRSARANTTLFASKPGLAPAWSSHWNPSGDVNDDELVLTPPTITAGIVVDEADKPVADAEVRVTDAYLVKSLDDGRSLFGYMNRMPEHAGLVTRTGPDGKFRLENCPTNAAMDLGVSKPGKVLREPVREYTSPETMYCQAGQQELKLVLEPAGVVEGKVRSQESGQPLAGARLSLQPDGPRVRHGNYETAVSGADGKFRLTQAAPGGYRLNAWSGTNEVTEWVAETVPLVVEAGRTTRDIEVFGTRGGLLEVTVRNKENRQPVSQIGIYAWKQEFQASADTDTHGMARLRMVPGDYRISVSQESSRTESKTATVESGQTNRIEFELNPPPKLIGTIRDPAGAPAAGLAVRLMGGFGSSEGQAETDATGRFELIWNPQRYSGMDRTVALVAQNAAHNLALAEDVEENTGPLDLRLAPGLTIVGRVEDGNGQPLTNALVRPFIWLGNAGTQFGTDRVKLDRQGRFEIAALPAGRRYSLSVEAKGYGSANPSIEREGEGDRLELEPIVLKLADRTLAGQVLNSDGKPVARASVSLYGSGQPNASATTDANGRFRFEHVCEGPLQLFARAQRAYGNGQAEGGDTNVVLTLGMNESSGAPPVAQRVPLKGRPLPDLGPLEFPTNCAPAGKPVLLCLADLEQRPSRRCLRLLADQHEALRAKGITLLALQAAVTTAESLKDWKASNPVPFPVGRVGDKAGPAKWATEVESLPWLILTDADHKVLAEGFALDELEAKLKLLTPGK